MPFTLEIQHGVYDVFERLRPGKAPLLGHVADQKYRDVLALRREEQLRRGFTYLANAPGRRLKLERKDGLYGIDDDQRRADAADLFEDPFEACLRQQVQWRVCHAQALAARLHLVFGLLA